MSAAVLTPPPVSPPSRAAVQAYRFTATEFDQMGDMGWFEGRRAFLLDGAILEQGPMNPLHADGVVLVNEALRAIFGIGFVVRPQLPLQVDAYNNPMPDCAVVAGNPRAFLGRHPTTAELVVEVSDSTLAIDMTEKAERYATAGIADYWVLDLVGRRLLVYRDPAPLPVGLGASAYRKQQAFAPTDRVSPLAAPNSSILVADMLP